MKILIALMIMMFSVGLFAQDKCKVEFTVPNSNPEITDTVNVCGIAGAKDNEKFSALYKDPSCKCDKFKSDDIKGNYAVETHCADDRVEGEFKTTDGKTVKGSKSKATEQ